MMITRAKLRPLQVHSSSNASYRAPFLLVGLLLVAGASIAAAQDTTFQGKILDPKGKPVAGATVTLTKVDDPAVTASATTDKKGGYKLSIAAAGELLLHADKEGYGPADRPVTAEAGMRFDDANLQLLDQAIYQQGLAIEAFNAGVQALQAGKEEEAIAQFEKAAEINPQLAQAHYARAAALHGLERWADAAKAIELYQELQPEDNRDELYQLAFEVYFGGGDLAKASQALAKIAAPAARAQLAPPIYNLGVKRNEQKDFDGAIAMFQKAAELDPGFAQAYQNSAAIEFNRQGYDKALHHLDQLLAAKPDSVEGLRLRFFCYRQLGDERMKSSLEAYLAKAPAAAGEEVAKVAGEDFDHGNAPLATKTLQALVEIKPDVAVAHYHLGRALASAGDNAGAKMHLQHFIDMAPNHRDAAAAKEMMAGL